MFIANPGNDPDPDVLRWGCTVKSVGGIRVHDLGCGSGRHAKALSASGLSVVASDIDLTSLKTGTCFRRHGGSVVPVLASLFECPFREASFDGVLAFNVLYHATWTDMVRAVQALYQTLKPGGLAYLTLATPDHGSNGRGQEVEPQTFLPPSGVLHHFTDRNNAELLLRRFVIKQWNEISFDYVTQKGETIRCVHWRVQARREER